MRNIFYYGFYKIEARLIAAFGVFALLTFSFMVEDLMEKKELGFQKETVVCRTITEVQSRDDGQKVYECVSDF